MGIRIKIEKKTETIETVNTSTVDNLIEKLKEANS